MLPFFFAKLLRMDKLTLDLIDHLSGFITENRLSLFKKVLGAVETLNVQLAEGGADDAE